MTIVFLKFLPQKYPYKAYLVKNTQINYFGSQIQRFLFLHKVLQLHLFEGGDFKYDNSFLKFQPKSTQITHFWSQIQAFSLFHNILQLDKFKSADFKYDNRFFLNSSPKIPKYSIFGQKYSNKTFLVPNLRCQNQTNLKVLI